MEATTQFIAFAIILLVFILNALVRLRRPMMMRFIRAFGVLPTMTGESIEANHALHVSLGRSAIGDETTVLSLVGAEFIYYMAQAVAVGDVSPVFTVSQPSALPIAFNTLRRAYNSAGRPQGYQPQGARWYPDGTRSLAFAAAITSLQREDLVSGNVLVGRYGIELALILDAANRYDRQSVAVSDLLTGQAIAYGLSHALIGEEIFAAPGYFSDDLRLQKRNLVLDWTRYAFIIGFIGFIIYSFITGSGG